MYSISLKSLEQLHMTTHHISEFIIQVTNVQKVSIILQTYSLSTDMDKLLIAVMILRQQFLY